MWMKPKEERTRLIRSQAQRLVVLPPDFVLPDGELIIRQEKDGVITLQPDQSKLSEEQQAQWAKTVMPGWADED
nr:hypothetical protein [uncultured Gellertiella sp.]